MVILQSYLGSLDGATALSIGWHISVVGQIYEQQLYACYAWINLHRKLKMALVNRAVSEAETGSPTRGGRPSTYVTKNEHIISLMGVKTFTSMSKRLSHFIVGAFDSNHSK